MINKWDLVWKIEHNKNKLDTLSNDFIKAFWWIIGPLSERIYHREDSYIYEMFVWLNSNNWGKNYLLSFNEKDQTITCSRFEMSKIPVFWGSKLEEIAKFSMNWIEKLSWINKLPKGTVNSVSADLIEISQAIISGIPKMDELLYLPPISETIKKFVTLKFDKHLKEFFAVKTKMWENNFALKDNYQLITEPEVEIMNEDMKHIKKRLKDALNQKFPNFKVAYSYVDDIKNLTERKKYIVEHNKTITSIIYDRYLQFILTGDIMDKTEAGWQHQSLDQYDEFLNSKSEVLLIDEKEKHLNKFVNYIYTKHNRIYSKIDLKEMVNDLLKDSSITSI